MGKRFAGCATGRAPAAFGGDDGHDGLRFRWDRLLDHDGLRRSRTNGMMGFGYVSPTAGSSQGWSSGGTVMVILMGLRIALVIGALAAWRPRRHQAAKTPLETPQARYARGDIDQQEFDHRRQALEGTT